MTILVLGVALWMAAHLLKRSAPDLRGKLGEKGKGLIALAILASVILMVIGYRVAETSFLWPRAGWATPANNLLMIAAIYFVTPGPMRGGLFYKMRHPMLTGFLIWVVAHLLVNGDSASVVLFGGLGVWALLEMFMINRVEPEWQPRPKGRLVKDAMFLAISILLVGLIGSLHLLFGLTPFGA